MPRALLNFDHWQSGYRVHFIQADCTSTIGTRTRYFQLADESALRTFVDRCHPVTPNDFDQSLRSWHRGSLLVDLTEEQYAKLKR